MGGGTISAGLFNAVARGVGLKIVGPQARHDPGASALHLMVRRELVESGEVAEYADLRGRTIGVVARGTVVDFLAALALARGGLQLADAELVELPFPDMTAAMSNGAIDAAIQTEPTATLAATRGVAVKWREAADLRPGLQAAAVFFAPHFAQQIDLAQRWMAAYLRGVRDYNDAFKKNIGRTEVIDVLTRQTTVKDPALYDRMGVSHIDPDGRVDADSLAEQLDWYAQQGLLTQPIEVAQALDLSFADAAVERLGPYA